MHRISIIENFISDEDINLAISEIENPSEINLYPKHYENRNGGTAFPYNKNIIYLFKKYGKKANEMQKQLNGFVNEIYVTKIFGSAWSHGDGAESPHIDAQELEPFIEWSTVIYLSDNFEGGEIFFPNQEYIYKPKIGSAVFFPSAGTEYMHGIKKIQNGKRYTMCIMHSSQKAFADPDILDKK